MSKKIKLIIGSIREGRAAEPISQWLVKTAEEAGYDIEPIDIKDLSLPMFAEPVSPMYSPVDDPKVKSWAAQIDSADALIFLTSEYNRSIPPSLKNAIDYLFAEWESKPTAIISYGFIDGGGSATKHLKDILNWVKVSLVEPNIEIAFGRTTHNEQGQLTDVDKMMSAYKDAYLSQLAALVA